MTPNRFARGCCLVGSVSLLSGAAVGAALLWSSAPQLGSTVGDGALLLLRRAALVVLGVTGVLGLDWAAVPERASTRGAGTYAAGLLSAAALVALLRGEVFAPVYWLPAATCFVSALAILRAGEGSTSPRAAGSP